jgi:hypothetical protein
MATELTPLEVQIKQFEEAIAQGPDPGLEPVIQEAISDALRSELDELRAQQRLERLNQGTGFDTPRL